jgi:hypothetical protein
MENYSMVNRNELSSHRKTWKNFECQGFRERER